MNYLLIDQLCSRLHAHQLIVVIREKTTDRARTVIKAVISGGAQVLEITLTTPNALELIREFSQKHPDLIIGAGSIMNAESAHQALEAQAAFLVSPFFIKEILAVCKNRCLYVPGFLTPQEAIDAYNEIKQNGDHNVLLKLFPANLFNINYLADLLKPCPFLHVMPSGGVNLANLTTWLDHGVHILSVGSSLSQNNNFKEIEKLTKKYLEQIDQWKKRS